VLANDGEVLVYNVKRLVARTTNMCKSAAGTHIFFGSATGPLELALGTVPTRDGGVLYVSICTGLIFILTKQTL
jgi:hypothetical protein